MVIDAGLITLDRALERAKVILYRGKREGLATESLPEPDRIDITGDWQERK
jgi:hypothetical protein